MRSFDSLDYTWFSPAIYALNDIPVDPTRSSNRYEEKKLLSDIRGQHIQFIQHRWFPTTEVEDTLVYIDARYEYRPDIISVDYYNSPLYAWAIMAANELRSVWQLKSGTYVKIPNIAKVVGGLK